MTLMLSEAVVNLAVVGITFLIISTYSLRFILRYKHQYESNPLCTTTVLICTFLVLLAAFIIPVDIFLVSFVKTSDGSFKQWATNETLTRIDEAVFASYYSLYGIAALLIFIVIPFIHFLNEESEPSVSNRVDVAMKYTFCFILVMILIMVTGAFIKVNANLEPNSVFNKIVHLKETTRFQDSVTLILAVITTLGFVNISFYTASGIFSWPIGLVFGTASVTNTVQAMSDQEELLRLRVSTLREKARTKRITPTESQQLEQVETDLAELERAQALLSGYNESFAFKMRIAVRPIQIVFGVMFGLLAILLLATLIIVNLDRILHSAGPKEGYILLKPTIFNVLEYIYLKFQDLVLIGPLPLLIVTCFLIVSTISGIRNLGLWLTFVRLYRVKEARTPPQALLFFCVTMMLTVLSFNLILYSMTSQFVTFGDQKLRLQSTNGTWTTTLCTLDDYHTDCVLTRASILLMRMMSQVWIFGAIFYWWSWAFVAVGLVSFAAYLIRGKRNATHGIVLDQDEFEN